MQPAHGCTVSILTRLAVLKQGTMHWLLAMMTLKPMWVCGYQGYL